MSDNLSIADIRRDYTLAGLRRADLDADAIRQFVKWFEQALAAKVNDANAMTLTTVDKQARPSARIVLLKKADERGFIFYTNYASRKGRDLAENPNAALTIYWPELERQICIAGTVGKISRAESEEYFNSRPKGSRLAAWTSHQSEVIPSRGVLEDRLTAVSAKYPGEKVPMPDYWGGYCLLPSRVEFWQGRASRLHDRFEYVRQPENGWKIDRLSP